MPTEKLTEAQIAAQLAARPEWSETGEAIQRTYQFSDFVTSMKFVNTVAQAAEESQHHPDVLIRYSKVTLTLSTHDAGGITAKDFALAAKADEVAAGLMPPAVAGAGSGAASGKKTKKV